MLRHGRFNAMLLRPLLLLRKGKEDSSKAGQHFFLQSSSSVSVWIDSFRNSFDNTPGQDLMNLSGRIAELGGAEEEELVGIMLAALKACSSLKDLQTGTQIHAFALENGSISNMNVANSLMHMYAKCGSLREARSLFESMPHRSVVSWNTAMFVFADRGEAKLTLELFHRMQEEGFVPSSLTYVAALKACAVCAETDAGGGGGGGDFVEEDSSSSEWLRRGQAIHLQAVSSLQELDLTLANTLIHMYAKCGSVSEARKVFDAMLRRDEVTWNALIFGYVDLGEAEEAVRFFNRMREEGPLPNALTYVAALKACGMLATGIDERSVEEGGWLAKGMEIHSQVVENGHETDIKVASTLVDMYAKLGSLENASRVFDRMKLHDTVSWNSIIMGYAQCQEGEIALRLFARMQEEGFTPNSRTVVAALLACGDLAGKAPEGKQVDGKPVRIWCLEKGREIHSHLAESDIFVANKLVDMYAKCGSLAEACAGFARMPVHDLVSFNVMLFGYADNGEGNSALQLFAEMMRDRQGLVANSQTFVAVLKACASCAAKEEGRLVAGNLVKVASLETAAEIRSEIEKSGYESDLKVASTLVDLYAKCGVMNEAWKVFCGMNYRDVVSWNSIVNGYAQSGEGELALQMFALMQEDGVAPDSLAFIAALKACSCIAGKEDGRRQVDGKIVKVSCLKIGSLIHEELRSSSLESDLKLANTLLDTYAKCGSMADAILLFQRIDRRDTVSWNAMILGYALIGEAEVALQYFAAMLEEGLSPNDVTLVAALRACGSLGSLRTGKLIYDEFRDAGLAQDAAEVANSLISFFGRCGSMAEAQQVFDSVARKQIVTWNALVAGYAHQGDCDRVFQLLERMEKEERLQIDGITFLCVLNACSHAGLVDKGREFFRLMMSSAYDIAPKIEHYACMVDLLGRANQLLEAMELIKSMSFKPNLTIWRTVLGAARKWKNVEVGKIAFEELLKLEDRDGAAYVLMANTYAAAGMWEDSMRVHGLSKSAGVCKRPGQSWWNDDAGKIHRFVAGDSTHPQIDKIQARLAIVTAKLKACGYVPDLASVLHNVPDDEKELSLCGHSERLAIGCALINTAPGTPIRIVKSLRVCDDCHKATAVISKVEDRVVVCRDASRFHVFKDGSCSCGNFW